MNNSLNKLTLQVDDANPQAILPTDSADSQPESDEFRFQCFLNLLTIVLIVTAIAIPYSIKGASASVHSLPPLSLADGGADSDSTPTAELDVPRIKVDSSDIVSVGYDSKTKSLIVEFKGERIYMYSDVPVEVYDSLMKAESHGVFFNQEIKSEGYEAVQLK